MRRHTRRLGEQGRSSENRRQRDDLQMTEMETSHFKVIADNVKSDKTLKEERGWHKMDVRWLVTGQNMDSKQTVVGRTIMPPGVKSRHATTVIRTRRNGSTSSPASPVSTSATNVRAARRRAASFRATSIMVSRTPPIRSTLATLWGYCGIKPRRAGYIIPEDGRLSAGAIAGAAPCSAACSNSAGFVSMFGQTMG